MEEISEYLSKLPRKEESVELVKAERAVSEEAPETLIYMKLKISRPVDELKMILDALKE